MRSNSAGRITDVPLAPTFSHPSTVCGVVWRTAGYDKTKDLPSFSRRQILRSEAFPRYGFFLSISAFFLAAALSILAFLASAALSIADFAALALSFTLSLLTLP